ncbi:DUF3047 domain-containing protein [Variovorax sp. J22P271]|uniref:DUF3047 domain-containing protein n=1 Tax=Variovorax davisae TaxID=3053515 RepID=UPI00257851CC|nr:DUF3047 domain-containing protein [Variovorax sp. J22P271]MDM0032560.1 DUF3047 domain-containing protein [Variovorax sp. J22P271]
MGSWTNRMLDRGRLCAAMALPAVAALLMAAPDARAQDRNLLTPFSGATGAQPPAPWHFTTLPNKSPTRFEVDQLDGQRVLKVDADNSYGNLVHPARVELNDKATLAWRWRVEAFVEGADLRTRAGDDGAAKVCVFFDFPLDRLSVGERTRLALARRATGEAVPTETLCYVWDNKEAKGNQFDNAFTKRIRMVVLESGAAAKPGSWTAERRNLLSDYRRAFGGEAGDIQPDVTAVAVSADADNTHGHGIAYFSDLDLRGNPPSPAAASAAAAAPAAAERPPQGQ